MLILPKAFEFWKCYTGHHISIIMIIIFEFHFQSQAINSIFEAVGFGHERNVVVRN
jgi:hypothetical protein